MASIHWEEQVRVPAERAWAMLRRPGEAHRLFAGVLVDGRVSGDIRTVTFANGMWCGRGSSTSTMSAAAWPMQ